MGLILKHAPNGEKYFEVMMPNGNVVSDLPVLQAFNNTPSTKQHLRLDLSLYPEPYAGNPKAKVYLLNGNPGWNSSDAKLMADNQPVWDTMMQHSYNPIPGLGHPQTLYWLDPYWKNQIKPVNGHDGGFTWWEKRTKQLSHIQNLEEKIFNIDFHPYHSQNLKINRFIHSLPSKAYVDGIIKDAFKCEDRLFVILRCRKPWEDRLMSILGVSTLPSNVIYLNNPRNVYLTPGKMNPADWSRFVDALK